MQAPCRNDMIGQNVECTASSLCLTGNLFFSNNFPSVSATLKKKYEVKIKT